MSLSLSLSFGRCICTLTDRPLLIFVLTYSAFILPGVTLLEVFFPSFSQPKMISMDVSENRSQEHFLQVIGKILYEVTIRVALQQ